MQNKTIYYAKMKFQIVKQVDSISPLYCSIEDMPLLEDGIASSLLVTFIIDAAIQITFFIPAAIFSTERYYDFSGAITYISCVLTALLWRQNVNDSIPLLSARQIIVACFVLLWAIRLGTWLFLRILREGHDARFNDLKKSPVRFFIPWFFQILWIYSTALPAYIILANPGFSQAPLIWSDIIGILIWIFGFAVEVVADYQKNVFKNKHPGDFVNVGIWKYSRYANYNGEWTLWIGMLILCIHGFIAPWQFVGVWSPIFVSILLFLVSGIPLLEKSSERKYGNREDYKRYKATTSFFFLWPPRSDGQYINPA